MIQLKNGLRGRVDVKHVAELIRDAAGQEAGTESGAPSA